MSVRSSGAEQGTAAANTAPADRGGESAREGNPAPTATHIAAGVHNTGTARPDDAKPPSAALDADLDADAPDADGVATKSVPASAGQQTAPACEDLMKAHRSPPKKSELDYEYLHQLRIARRELVRGNLDAAHAAFCRATLDPGADMNVWTEFAQLLVLRRDGVAAIPWAERALKYDPRNVRARGLLGDALMLAGRTEEARGAWLLAVNETEANDAAIQRLVKRNLGEAQRALKGQDPARAERFFRRVLAFDEQNAKALEGLAAVQTQLGTTS